MKKYLMALIFGFAVLMTVSSCDDNMNEITKQENGTETKVERPS